MVRYFLSVILIAGLALPLFPAPTQAELDVNINELLSDEALTNPTDMTKEELQTFLRRGSLGTYKTTDVNGTERPVWEIVWKASQEFRLSPRFLLVLLQREQSLVEDDYPTQDQLDWAMGYAICDDCSKDDPAIQKYRGFGPQVYYAAKRIRESYLDDLHTTGETIGGIAVGAPTIIDGVTVIPSNKATAVLYTYTPHLHGNENFVRIWRRWFIPDYPNGTLLQNKKTGAVWLIRNGERQPITTRTAFASRYSDRNLIAVDPNILTAYPIGNAIRYPNYSLLRSSQGTVYLLVDQERRGIASAEAFRQLGFSEDEIIDVSSYDLDAYPEGVSLSTESAQPQGALLQNNKTGGVYYVENGVKHAIFSREILTTRFQNSGLISTDPKTLDTYETAEPVFFPDGTLVAVRGTPEIYVVSDGWRRHIEDEETFKFFGWRWNQIIWTDERSANLHPMGTPIARPQVEEEKFEETL